MRRRALWACRWKYPLLEELPSAPQLAVTKRTPAQMLVLGQVTREALERLAPRCLVLQWCVELLRESSSTSLAS